MAASNPNLCPLIYFSSGSTSIEGRVPGLAVARAVDVSELAVPWACGSRAGCGGTGGVELEGYAGNHEFEKGAKQEGAKAKFSQFPDFS